MRYNLNDNAVKRIAAIAHHMKGDPVKNISGVFHNLEKPATIMAITNAHTTDAMQHKFKSKDDENRFKVHLAKASAINRGTLDPVPEPSAKAEA